jgi:polyisoprenoid-binding protein YceI
MMRRSTLHAAVIALALAASSSQAAWHVDSGQSSFSFTTAKAGMPGTSAVEEVQTFRQIGGSLADDGKLVFDVELACIETNIGLRNDRLKELLFKVADNPKAVFTGSVDPRRLNALGVGASLDMDVSGQLALGGQSKPLTASVRVVKLASDALLVGTRVPIVVNLKDYGLQDGVEALRAVMNLNVLASSAPVSFSVMMKPGR